MYNKILRIFVAFIIGILVFLTFNILQDLLGVVDPQQKSTFDAVFYTLIYALGAMVVSNALTALVNTNVGFFSWIPERMAPVAELIAKYGAWIVAFGQIVPLWGGDVSHVLGAIGIFGVGIAFASQSTVQNLFGFARIIATDAFNEGEKITCNGGTGVVKDIGMFDTVIETDDFNRVTIPNNVFATSPIINHSDIGKAVSTGEFYVPMNMDKEALRNLMAAHDLTVVGTRKENYVIRWQLEHDTLDEMAIDAERHVYLVKIGEIKTETAKATSRA